MGKKIIRVLRTGEETIATIGAAVEFFRAHGNPRELIGDTLQRTGFPALEAHIDERMGREA
jgi:hypothetical protein